MRLTKRIGVLVTLEELRLFSKSVVVLNGRGKVFHKERLVFTKDWLPTVLYLVFEITRRCRFADPDRKSLPGVYGN